jgi:hypothetical protein
MSEPTANAENPDEAPAETPAETPEADQPEEFLNRAARRARGKAKGHHHHTGHGEAPAGGRGSVQSPRQYGTRRSG